MLNFGVHKWKFLGHGLYEGGGSLHYSFRRWGGGEGGWVGVVGRGGRGMIVLISSFLLNRSWFRAILKVVGLS